MNIFVTGGAGLLGQRLSQCLIRVIDKQQQKQGGLSQ